MTHYGHQSTTNSQGSPKPALAVCREHDGIEQSALGVEMLKLLQRGARCESGVTAIEYGVIVALIIVAAIGAMRSVGERSAKPDPNITPATMSA